MASKPNSPGRVETVPSVSPDVIRRARKRATDRKSQQNHRERQRAYVRSLERTLAALRGASNSDERVAALLAENDKIRKRCDALISQLSRIRTIANEIDAEPATPLPSLFDSVEGGSDFLNHDTQPSPYHTSTDYAILSDEAAAATFVVPDAIQTLPGQPLLDLVTFMPHNLTALLDNTLSAPCSPPIPQYANPQGAADRLLHAMLEEARVEHCAGKFDLSEPTLKDLLMHRPGNILSFRLFHYIRSYGPMPMHWMLATFWVQYLYLRWNVLETAESYALVPHFLRPTPLECTIPHRVCINMLVWPDIRHALIRDALTVDPEGVAIELLKSLPPNWPPLFAMTGEMIASMDLYRMIEIQSVRYDFWKVGAGFHRTYPQYKSCNLGHAY